MMRPKQALADRFWPKVQVGSPDECWNWIAKSHTPNGYGVAWADLGDGARLHTAHRVAYFLATGDHPSRRFDIMHACDNRKCCNPAHLSKGSRGDNMRDCAAKGRTRRSPTVWGERHHLAKLTDEAVRDIRVRTSAGERQKDIAARYGVKREAVRRITTGRHWGHVQ